MARKLNDSSSLMITSPYTPSCNNGLDCMDTKTPQNGLSHLRQRLEMQLMRHSQGDVFKTEDKISPTLAKLRMTPGIVY